MSTIAVVGTGYVGLATSACLASLGHEVVGIDVDADKVERLGRAEVDIVEPGLPELVRDGLRQGTLRFSTDPSAAADAELVFLCVPTPPADDGRADLTHVCDAACALGPVLRPGSILAVRSTVPPGSTRIVQRELGRDDVTVVSNPEFLREGHAVHDCLHPDRVVIGSDDEASAARVASLHRATGAPVVVTDPATAELTKYAANAFLATKLSFVNSIAAICEEVGADVGDLVLGLSHDARIGAAHLDPGPGWGGSCLPKDTRALVAIAQDAGVDVAQLRGTIAANEAQRRRVVDAVRRAVERPLAEATVAVWGLTFKAGTDDRRESPSLAVVDALAAEGATVRAHDPTVGPDAELDGLTVHGSAVEAATGAHVLVLLTEWDDYRRVDPAELVAVMARPHVIDARNALDRAALVAAGVTYRGTGR